MEAISIESDPHLYFQVGKIKISEGMKCLQDLVQWYNNNLIPENAGILDATMAYLQSLQQEIESLAPQREALVSSNVNGTDLQRGQEITQMREQNAYFGPTLNQDTEMVINPNIESTRAKKKRKLRSKVWEDFRKYEGIDGKEWAKCKHCEKDFLGSSKSGTTHLKNHLKSCQTLGNLGGVVDKEKKKSLINPALNGSDMVLKIIKYGLKSIKNDILDVSTKARNLWLYMSSNEDKFRCAVEKAESMGKKVTSKSVPGFFLSWDLDWDWIMGGKEAFCEVEHIDPDFKSINFTKEEWDEATLLYNSWEVLQDLKKEIFHLMYPKYKTANVYFLAVCDVFFKIVQLGKSENHYYCHVAARFREILEMYWDDFNLILVITTILDPRFKMDVVKKFYQEFYDDPVYLEKIIIEVTNIYSKYAEGTNNDIATSESELDRYLSDSKCSSTEEFDILE